MHKIGCKMYRHIAGIPMGTNCTHLVVIFFFVMRDNSFCLFLTIIRLGVIEGLKKQVSMTRKCHNHRPQTNPRRREETKQKNRTFKFSPYITYIASKPMALRLYK